ncbi:hypothetical protein RclHR1_09200003 [Rhizophagus clarus]|uniref:Uncharacterized protein n=1 Tax=Rhizophagus clarus TaxID=94130 RepID=A0A2Z6S3D3_9GLOM|nr:hypothetical protein RclHR1_09200003 [Rhizophagus clarus]
MLQIKICLLTFAFAFFEQKYDNTPLAISLYISSLETGHYIKGKEENSFVYILMTYLKNLVSGYSQLIFGNLPIKAIKQFETGGKASIVVFFEKYEDVEICRRTRFTFSHNDVDYSLPWCSAPITASQTKKSKDSSGSSKKSKTNDSFKKTKNFSFSKTHSINSKSNKNKTKTLKKSKDKKKKKSSGKKSDDKMDIVKLLLTLISKF